MARFIILMLLITLSSSVIFSQNQNKPEDLVAYFFKVFEKDGSDAAIDYFFSTNKYMEQSVEKIDEIKNRLKKAIGLLQSYFGYEIIKNKTLGESLTMLDCMVKYDRQPIQFTFTLYKPKDEWVFQNIKFDYNLEDDLKSIPDNPK